MSIKSKKFKVVGKTSTGITVVKGMFEFIDQFGLPAEMFCFECKNKGFIPDWLHFCKEAKKANWSPRRIMECVREGASVWGNDWMTNVVKRIQMF